MSKELKAPDKVTQKMTRDGAVENILAAMPYMDEDMRQLAAAAVNKLQAMTDSEFSEREFILTDEE